MATFGNTCTYFDVKLPSMMSAKQSAVELADNSSLSLYMIFEEFAAYLMIS
jgi:hypothetical protein